MNIIYLLKVADISMHPQTLISTDAILHTYRNLTPNKKNNGKTKKADIYLLLPNNSLPPITAFWVDLPIHSTNCP